MNTVIVLIASIAKYTSSINGFLTRLKTLATKRKKLETQMARHVKDLNNLHEREEIVRSYLKKTERGTVRYEESAGGLKALATRVQKKNAEIDVAQESIALNERTTANIEKFLETSKRHLAESKANLVEAKEKEARQKAADEVVRIKKQRADRKAEKHARNRARNRAKKKAKVDARLAENVTPTPDADAPSGAFYQLANELGADITNPEDRAAVTALLEDVPVTA